MSKITPHAQLELSKSGMLNNYRYFRSKLKSTTKLLVLVKANSYGHGAIEFAQSLEDAGADYLGVAFPVEGIQLKKNGITLPVLVLTCGLESYPEIIKYDLEPGMPNMESLIRFRDELRKAGKSSYPVHIKIDTGMHRLGFMKHEIPALKTFIEESPEIIVKSIYSHLAASDETLHDKFTLEQIALYDELSTDLISILPYKPIRHILNSAGIERFPQYQFDMVRLGIGIYGISAVDQKLMKPSAYFRCPILQIKELKAEDGTVGYGRHGKLGPGIKRIATICVGYADGINRHLGRGNASFEINGKLAPTIGNICMDMCMIDITGIDAQVGDTVTIFGEKPHAKDLAKILDTIPYEIFTSIPQRVKKVLIP